MVVVNGDDDDGDDRNGRLMNKNIGNSKRESEVKYKDR